MKENRVREYEIQRTDQMGVASSEENTAPSKKIYQRITTDSPMMGEEFRDINPQQNNECNNTVTEYEHGKMQTTEAYPLHSIGFIAVYGNVPTRRATTVSTSTTLKYRAYRSFHRRFYKRVSQNRPIKKKMYRRLSVRDIKSRFPCQQRYAAPSRKSRYHARVSESGRIKRSEREQKYGLKKTRNIYPTEIRHDVKIQIALIIIYFTLQSVAPCRLKRFPWRVYTNGKELFGFGALQTSIRRKTDESRRTGRRD
ncbi:hypothetical protein DBV15_01657 [Temnothorax longispinosus]|uniref:Uncharacterized protein n=1 Tax=Temnothorax longispinosus TaxID=300112 RepID=A0A4S2L0J1_9HYME|nr:hypothetical protein DBV15_01657 [Temnothorax longispinosus]